MNRYQSTLEDNLGTRLLDHSRDGYDMTQAAENMYEHARRMAA